MSAGATGDTDSVPLMRFTDASRRRILLLHPSTEMRLNPEQYKELTDKTMLGMLVERGPLLP